MPMEPPEGRKVKSGPVGAVEATDRHERAKDYLSPAEMARLLDAAKAGRHGGRDHLLLLMTYRHGLRVSEAVGLRRDALDLDRARLWAAASKAACRLLPVSVRNGPIRTVGGVHPSNSSCPCCRRSALLAAQDRARHQQRRGYRCSSDAAADP